MRSTKVLQLAGAVALAVSPAIAGAAPVRAGAALPKAVSLDTASSRRAATSVEKQSSLIGFPVLALVGLTVAAVTVVAVASSGSGRSPG